MRAYPTTASELASSHCMPEASPLPPMKSYVLATIVPVPPRSATVPQPVPEQGGKQLSENPSESCHGITKTISISEPL